MIWNICRMRLEDFCSFFTDFDICCLCPSVLDGEQPCKWRKTMFEGRWVSEVTAGGCRNYKGTAATRGPQILRMTGSKRSVLWIVDEANKLHQLLRML